VPFCKILGQLPNGIPLDCELHPDLNFGVFLYEAQYGVKLEMFPRFAGLLYLYLHGAATPIAKHEFLLVNMPDHTNAHIIQPLLTNHRQFYAFANKLEFNGWELQEVFYDEVQG
jgi:hypothetical protein